VNPKIEDLHIPFKGGKRLIHQGNRGIPEMEKHPRVGETTRGSHLRGKEGDQKKPAGNAGRDQQGEGKKKGGGGVNREKAANKGGGAKRRPGEGGGTCRGGGFFWVDADRFYRQESGEDEGTKPFSEGSGGGGGLALKWGSPERGSKTTWRGNYRPGRRGGDIGDDGPEKNRGRTSMLSYGGQGKKRKPKIGSCLGPENECWKMVPTEDNLRGFEV